MMLPTCSLSSNQEPRLKENGLPYESWWQNLSRNLLSGLGLDSLAQPTPDKDPFYDSAITPEELKMHLPGTILRSRAIYLVDFPGFDAEKLTGWQFAYVTRGQEDDQATSNVTVATVIVPDNVRERRDRVLFIAPKVDSANPLSRTSFMLRRGSGSMIGGASEQIFMVDFLQLGLIIVMVDYEGQHDAFGAGPTAGHAFLDAMRATLTFRDVKLAPKEQLSFVGWGYSGGGIAISWANVLMPTYAPELTPLIKAWSTGGLPCDLHAVAKHVNNGLAAGLIIGVIGGLGNIYPNLRRWVEEKTNAVGKEIFQMTATAGFGEIMVKNAFVDVLNARAGPEGPINTYFNTNGDPLDDPVPKQIMQENSLLAKVRIMANEAQTGTITTAATTPLFLYESIYDEVVPIDVVDKLVTLWSQLGTASIDYQRVKTGLHVMTIFAMHSQNVKWISDRFEGTPLTEAEGSVRMNENLRQSDVHSSIDDEDSLTNLGKKRTQALQSFFNKHYDKKRVPWWI